MLNVLKPLLNISISHYEPNIIVANRISSPINSLKLPDEPLRLKKS